VGTRTKNGSHSEAPDPPQLSPGDCRSPSGMRGGGVLKQSAVARWEKRRVGGLPAASRCGRERPRRSCLIAWQPVVTQWAAGGRLASRSNLTGLPVAEFCTRGRFPPEDPTRLVEALVPECMQDLALWGKRKLSDVEGG
jgi:hypothetical protein